MVLVNPFPVLFFLLAGNITNSFSPSIITTQSAHGFHLPLNSSLSTTDSSYWLTTLGLLWPDATVVYELDPALTQSDRFQVSQALEEISTHTCVRFREKCGWDRDYTLISVENANTSTTTNTCGFSHTCRLGGQQIIKFVRNCAGGLNIRTIMIHELLHTLCFGHEHERQDRDSFVSFAGCDKAPPIKEDLPYRLMSSYPYDYYSVMHYPCGGCAGGGNPRMSGVTSCGYQHRPNHLGVMDADKINDRYDCQGCFSHRWKPTDTLLTSPDSSNLLITFDDGGGRGKTRGICRGYVLGNLVVGTYFVDGATCHLVHGGREVVLLTNGSQQAQVLTARSESELAYYTFVNLHDDYKADAADVLLMLTQYHYSLVAAGMSSDSDIGYVGLWPELYSDGKKSPTGRRGFFGTVWGGRRSKGAWEKIKTLGDYQHQSSSFSVLVCNRSSLLAQSTKNRNAPPPPRQSDDSSSSCTSWFGANYELIRWWLGGLLGGIVASVSVKRNKREMAQEEAASAQGRKSRAEEEEEDTQSDSPFIRTTSV